MAINKITVVDIINNEVFETFDAKIDASGTTMMNDGKTKLIDYYKYQFYAKIDYEGQHPTGVHHTTVRISINYVTVKDENKVIVSSFSAPINFEWRTVMPDGTYLRDYFKEGISSTVTHIKDPVTEIHTTIVQMKSSQAKLAINNITVVNRVNNEIFETFQRPIMEDGRTYMESGIGLREYYELFFLAIVDHKEHPIGTHNTVVRLSINYVTVRSENGEFISSFIAPINAQGRTIMPNGEFLRVYYGDITDGHGTTSRVTHTEDPITRIHTTVVQMLDKNKTITKPIVEPDPPEIPPRPKTIEFYDDKPNPPNSKLERINKFLYFFGVNEINFKHKNLNENCCYISKDINVGRTEKLELESSYNVGSFSSVEFYIIDEDGEHPILPTNESMVRNEKIFFNMPLRFQIDRSKEFTIRKDGEEINITVDQAISSSDGLYTIDYYPIGGRSYANFNKNVKVKTILRAYKKYQEVPYIKNILLKAYGGEALWIDRA